MSLPAIPLKSVLPARARRVVYSTYGLAALTVGAAQIGYASIPGGMQPLWLTVAISVTAFLAAPVATLAATNTPAGDASTERTVELHGGQPWDGEK